MKKNILFLLIIASFLIAGCTKEEPPTIETTSSTSINAAVRGDKKTVTFTCNKKWTAESADSWCVVEPTSGEAGTNTVSITIQANDTYAVRNNKVTIHVQDILLDIDITQSEKQGAFASKNVYDLDASEQTISIEINSNISYESKISVDWISAPVTTKALEKSYLDYLVQKNKYFEPRSGNIVVIGSGLASFDTIRVNQEAAPTPAFVNENVYGMYGTDKSIMKMTFAKYEDQTSVTNGLTTNSFRIQNLNKELFLTLSGIPKSISVGDIFKVDLLQNYIPDGDEHLSLEAQAIKVEDGTAWIYCVEEELGFIIKR